MTTADLINGGISLAIALYMALLGFGSIPFSKDPDKNRVKREKFGWIALVGAIIVGVMGVFKLFGVMR